MKASQKIKAASPAGVAAFEQALNFRAAHLSRRVNGEAFGLNLFIATTKLATAGCISPRSWVQFTAAANELVFNMSRFTAR
jgi:hypothetical protein